MSERIATVRNPLERAETGADWRARDRSRQTRVWSTTRLAGDAVALAAGVSLSGAAAPEALGQAGALAAIALSLLVFVGTGAYVPQLRPQIVHELRQILGGSAFAFAAVAGLILIDPSRTGAGDAAIVCWLVAGTMISVSRLGIATAQRYARRQGWDSSRTLVIGAGKIGTLTAQRLLDDPSLGLKPIGYLDKEPLASTAADRRVTQLPVLGASWDLERVVATHSVDQVVIAFSTAPQEVLVDLVRRCWALGVNVLVVPRLFEVEGRRVQVQHLGALPLISLATTDPQGKAFAVKYFLDRVIAVIALVALSPILAVLSLAVIVSTGRPVLFRQKRVGRDGRTFDILKFRTMRGRPEQDGDGNSQWVEWILSDTGVEPPPVPAADRRTRVGSFLRKCSLDELPQLWNVVRGDMSIVGPRPEVPHFASLFETAIARYPERHRVKSGLTGWAQIHGLRGDTSLQDRVEWDNFYIENWSLWLDLKIMLRTLPSLIGKGGEVAAAPPVTEPELSDELSVTAHSDAAQSVPER